MVISFFEKESGELSVDNVVDRINFKRSFELDSTKEHEFAASHFFEIEESKLKKLSIDDLMQILSNSSLKLDNEDQLCSLALSLAEEDSSFVVLFQEIRFEYLSCDQMRSFCEFFMERSDHMDSVIWSRLMKRLCLDVEPDECQNRYKSVEPKKPSGIDLSFKGNSLEGIIH